MSESSAEAGTDLRLVRLAPDDRSDAKALLESHDLPTTDVGEPDVLLFRGVVDGQPVGVGGFELFDENALLRSVAIEEDRQGQRFGTALCRELERSAREHGARTLYLLTTDASGFFERLGFDRCEREAVPAAVRESREFSDLCPVSAVCMVKEVV